MGEAAWTREATPDELERMGAEVRRAMADGAIGFSSTTNLNHVGDRGRPVPSRLGSDRELEYLAAAMGSTGRGIVELTIGGSRPDRVAEVDRYAELARAARRPVTMVSVRHNPVRPEEHRRILEKVEAAWREGLRLHPQGTCSPLTSTFTITNGFVFGRYKAWRRVLEAKPSEWRGILADPGFRAEFRENVRRTALFNGDIVPLRIKRVVKPELQRFAGKSVVELARDTGKDVVDAFLDLTLADDFRTEFMSATMNTDAAAVAEIFMHPTAVLGLSDAGAHITQFSEAGQTSQLLGHWVRERQALSLEAAVRLITGAPAEIFGIPDRGRLAPGSPRTSPSSTPAPSPATRRRSSTTCRTAGRATSRARAASSGRSSTAARSSATGACPSPTPSRAPDASSAPREGKRADTRGRRSPLAARLASALALTASSV